MSLPALNVRHSQPPLEGVTLLVRPLLLVHPVKRFGTAIVALRQLIGKEVADIIVHRRD